MDEADKSSLTITCSYSEGTTMWTEWTSGQIGQEDMWTE